MTPPHTPQNARLEVAWTPGMAYRNDFLTSAGTEKVSLWPRAQGGGWLSRDTFVNHTGPAEESHGWSHHQPLSAAVDPTPGGTASRGPTPLNAGLTQLVCHLHTWLHSSGSHVCRTGHWSPSKLARFVCSSPPGGSLPFLPTCLHSCWQLLRVTEDCSELFFPNVIQHNRGSFFFFRDYLFSTVKTKCYTAW